ncbi:intracellular hyaluronan-binding protein 4-like isoform X2 [Megalops cyprinoides]|uniref:intracellular hyaluronan-binding protein 4-like isoform X2 n=1 Tax=Megalops cyprinoides TaxID=118141 RepID=UPI00186533A0|nr:intracellular hyaluronan-binding protein 4-like isoform X2 [Megalops cyprinoides]
MQQDTFGCSVMNRFDQLLDDEADPFDILREVELEKQKKKKKEELKKAKEGKHGKRESQKDRKLPQFVDGGVGQIRNSTGRRRFPRGGHVQNENRGSVETERDQRRVVFRERRPNQMEAPNETSLEVSSAPWWDKGSRGRGGSRGVRDGYPRNVDSFDQRTKREFDCQDEPELATRTNEMCGDAAESQEVVEMDSQTRASEEADGEEVEKVAVEMSLDEWRALQEQSRPKQELNLRKADTRVPSKAVVIHKSKHLQAEREALIEEDEEAHFFRRPANDITTKLVFNFGNLPRPSRGGRGGRGGRGRGGAVGRTERAPAQTEVVQVLAPNPDDLEDFPALA